MKIGIPREVKILEGRIALTPYAVKELLEHNHQVFIEQNAGVLSGYSDKEYTAAGALVLDSAKAVYDVAKIIVKLKNHRNLSSNCYVKTTFYSHFYI